jgi:hypothetical protein
VATGRITAVTTGDSVTLSFFFVGIGLPYVRAYLTNTKVNNTQRLMISGGKR